MFRIGVKLYRIPGEQTNKLKIVGNRLFKMKICKQIYSNMLDLEGGTMQECLKRNCQTINFYPN
jgi:hypothetical protein